MSRINFETSAYKFIHKLHPSYRPRWEIYDDLLLSYLSKEKIWLDIGCGNNDHVSSFHDKVKQAAGIDIIRPKYLRAPFIQADMKAIPLKSNCADLITLRFVVEHLKNIPQDLPEVLRVLKPDGHLIIFTTNTFSPFVFLPKLLPFSVKSFLIRLVFKIEAREIFPTYHRFNSPLQFKRIWQECELEKLLYIENIAAVNILMFTTSAIWYLLTKVKPMDMMRSNLLAVYRKIKVLEK
jgi:ubiquinone/menaquinone biosynthesis C-methylase UbiE